MADNQGPVADSSNISAGATPDDQKSSRPSSTKNSNQGATNRDERIRALKEKQSEERQRKLDELKHQAVATQKLREQKEEERKRKLDEMRARDCDRRAQVEERKRQIWEAERDRREAILRKNQEREARIEAKRKNERSSIVFAFGSSTPRMLEPGEAASYWATRRATSTTNVMTLSMSAAAPLTRRSSERELDGGKKRATSAGGFDRKSPLGLKSGEATPSRPVSSMSQASVASNLSQVSTNLRVKAPGTPRRPRPISIAVTGVTSPASSEKSSASKASSSVERPPIPKVHTTKKQQQTNPSPKPESAKKPTDKVKINKQSPAAVKNNEIPCMPGEDPGGAGQLEEVTSNCGVTMSPVDLIVSGEVSPAAVALMTSSVISEPIPEEPRSLDPISLDPIPSASILEPTPATPVAVNGSEEGVASISFNESVKVETEQQPASQQAMQTLQIEQSFTEDRDSEMNTSMTSKTRITTEEEAKAALAERRRLAREQAEREAELERQRLEAERIAEEERLRQEEEDQRRMEEEQLKLLEEAKRAEELRLQQAIEEAQKREEEEKKRREEEAKQKLEKEEAERKAKEEAEKQRKEMEEKLKKEEEDRQVRRKRVEAIMLRTRGKGSTSASTPTKDGEDDGSPPNDKMSSSMISESDKFLASERNHNSDSSVDLAVMNLAEEVAAEAANQSQSNGSVSQDGSSAQLSAAVMQEQQLINNNLSEGNVSNNKHNGHHNGSIHSVQENNVTNSLLDLEPVDQILDLPSSNGKISDPPQIQFLGFPEKSEPPTVNDLLS